MIDENNFEDIGAAIINLADKDLPETANRLMVDQFKAKLAPNIFKKKINEISPKFNKLDDDHDDFLDEINKNLEADKPEGENEFSGTLDDIYNWGDEETSLAEENSQNDNDLTQEAQLPVDEDKVNLNEPSDDVPNPSDDYSLAEEAEDFPKDKNQSDLSSTEDNFIDPADAQVDAGDEIEAEQLSEESSLEDDFYSAEKLPVEIDFENNQSDESDKSIKEHLADESIQDNQDDEFIENNLADKANYPSDYEKAFNYLLQYKIDNRAIVYKALTDSSLKNKEREKIYQKILLNTPENELIYLIYKYINKNGKLLEENNQEQIKKSNYFSEKQTTIFKYIAISFAALLLVFVFYQNTHKYIQAYSYYQEGFEALTYRQYQESEELFKKASQLWIRIGQFNRYAKKYFDYGRFYDAERYYLEALKIAPKSDETWINYLRLLRHLGRFGEAETLAIDGIKQFNQEKFYLEKALVYLDWYRTKGEKLDLAKLDFQSLLQKDSKNLFYWAKLMEINIYEDNYFQVKEIYQEIKKRKISYLEISSFKELLKYYLSIYQKKYKDHLDDGVKKDQQLYIVREINHLTSRFYALVPLYLPAFELIAQWYMNINKFIEAETIVNKGIAHYLKGSRSLGYNPFALYDIKGQVKIHLEEIDQAIEAFKESINLNEKGYLAYLYLGKINLKELDNIDKAKEYFIKSFNHWSNKEGTLYLDLLSGLAYTHYYKGLDLEKGVHSTETYFKSSLDYWKELDFFENNKYVQYGMGNCYMKLKNYNLAIAQYLVAIKGLDKYVEEYSLNEGDVSIETRQNIYLLSDLLNNLAVAQMIQSYRGIDRDDNRKKALLNVIQSIDLKEKLKLKKGIVNHNFNEINRNREQAINNLIISDEFLKYSLKDTFIF